MQHLEVSCAVRRLYRSLGVKGLKKVKIAPQWTTKAQSGSRGIQPPIPNLNAGGGDRCSTPLPGHFTSENDRVSTVQGAG